LNGSVEVRETATGRTLLALDGQGEVHFLAFAPDGATLALVDNDTFAVRLAPLAGRRLGDALGESAFELGDHDGVYGLAFSPAGDLLASVSITEWVKLWDLGSGRAAREIWPDPNRTYDPWHDYSCCAAFSPDGRRLAIGTSDGLVRLYDPATGALVRALKGHERKVLALAFSPAAGGPLASAGEDGKVLLREVEGEREQARRQATGAMEASPDEG
jgi:WD40 repeat protein